jgi:hypothetical protein
MLVIPAIWGVTNKGITVQVGPGIKQDPIQSYAMHKGLMGAAQVK